MKLFIGVWFVSIIIAAPILPSESLAESLGGLQHQLEALSRTSFSEASGKQKTMDEALGGESAGVIRYEALQKEDKNTRSNGHKLALLKVVGVDQDMKLRGVSTSGNLFFSKIDENDKIYRIQRDEKNYQAIMLTDGWLINGVYNESNYLPWPILLSKPLMLLGYAVGIFDINDEKAKLVSEVGPEAQKMLTSDRTNLLEDIYCFNSQSLIMRMHKNICSYGKQQQNCFPKKELRLLDITANYMVQATAQEVHFCNVSTPKATEIIYKTDSAFIWDVQIREQGATIIVAIVVGRGSTILDELSTTKFVEIVLCTRKADSKTWQQRILSVKWPQDVGFQLNFDGTKGSSVAKWYAFETRTSRRYMVLFPRILVMDSEKYVLADLPEQYKENTKIMVASDDGNYIAAQSEKAVLLWHLEST